MYSLFSQEALLHELTKLQLLVLVGPTLLVAVTVMPVPLGIVVQPMVGAFVFILMFPYD